jgi:plastocyanin
MQTAATWGLVVDAKGESSYVCALHPAMKGRLIAR